MNEFWKVGTVYKHMGYPGRKWKMICTTEDHVRLDAIDGNKPYYLMTPKDLRPSYMYRTVTWH